MINRETLQGNWNVVKGKLRSRWGQLTDAQLEEAHGDVDRLVGTIQKNTGAAREDVEQYLDELGKSSGGWMAEASEAVREYAHDAVEQVQRQSDQATEAVRHGYEQTQGMIRRRPVESLAACFGVGLVTGIVVGLLLRSK